MKYKTLLILLSCTATHLIAMKEKPLSPLDPRHKKSPLLYTLFAIQKTQVFKNKKKRSFEVRSVSQEDLFNPTTEHKHNVLKDIKSASFKLKKVK